MGKAKFTFSSSPLLSGRYSVDTIFNNPYSKQPISNPAIAQLESGAGGLTEGDYYATTIQGGGYWAPFGYRPGSATRTNSCQHVREVPLHIRSAAVMKPWGLSSFYKKYTESYGIPVLASHNVPDDALRRACYTLRFLLAGNSAVRESFYRYSGRVAVIGRDEGTTSIPEHSSLPSWWNLRARGLGATPHAPVSSGGEENVLCYRADRYSNQDILLHESAHGVHLLGAAHGIPGWDQRLRSLFNESKSRGLWANTYSMTSPEEYFAVGAQSYFNCNSYSAVPDGVRGPINTRAKLRAYDPKLYSLIQEVFPCDNTYLKRCQSSRVDEDAQRLHMDCDTAAESSGGECIDNNKNCVYWASTNACTTNAAYMQMNCQRSCNLCNTGGLACTDNNPYCPAWALRGDCQTHSAYMSNNCRESCELC